MHFTGGDFCRALCAGESDSLAGARLAIVVAHPDDETIGLGSRLMLVAPQCRMIYLTDGAPHDLLDARAAGCASREEYAWIRRQELLRALALAGISAGQVWMLDCVDLEAGLALAPLARELADDLRQLEPEFVLTHPYEGGHPDHDAAAFAVHAACRLLRESGAAAPTIIEMTSYHRGRRGIACGEFLPPQDECYRHELTAHEHERKRRMIECFVSQRETLRWFALGIESFRVAPAYDFLQPPHPGPLYYEQFAWGMTGERFRELVRGALEELGIQAPAGAAVLL